VDLRGAKLGEVDLRGAKLYETVFADVDLSATNGLDACTHWRPSIIDHRTLQRCGLPDRLIDP
jgi:uncharacterized protein YjbI with pentapeptide repeats